MIIKDLFFAQRSKPTKSRNLGLPDYFQNHASRNELLKEAGLDAAGIENSVQKFVRETIPAHVSKT